MIILMLQVEKVKKAVETANMRSDLCPEGQYHTASR